MQQMLARSVHHIDGIWLRRGGAEAVECVCLGELCQRRDSIRVSKKEFGVRVVVDTFASNEDLLTKLQSGASGYDIIMPSDFMVGVMIKQKLAGGIRSHQHSELQEYQPAVLGKIFRSGKPLFSSLHLGHGGDSVRFVESARRLPTVGRCFGKRGMAADFSMLDDQREVIGAALKNVGVFRQYDKPGGIGDCQTGY